MRVRNWVMAGVGAVALGLLGAGASVGDGSSSHRGARATADGGVVEVEDAELEQVVAHSSVASPGSPAQFRLKEERDGLVLRLTDRLAYLESVVAGATPGWPAQFRAREEAESLREQLRSVGSGAAPVDLPR